MKSICKNCAYCGEEGPHLFCARTIKYVHPDDSCEHFKMDEEKGDIDRAVFAAFAITIVAVGFLLMILTNI